VGCLRQLQEVQVSHVLRVHVRLRLQCLKILVPTSSFSGNIKALKVDLLLLLTAKEHQADDGNENDDGHDYNQDGDDERILVLSLLNISNGFYVDLHGRYVNGAVTGLIVSRASVGISTVRTAVVSGLWIRVARGCVFSGV